MSAKLAQSGASSRPSAEFRLMKQVVEDPRNLLRKWTVLVGIAATVSWIIALYGVIRAPWVNDLYHMINPGPSHKGESSVFYLFTFPGVITVAFFTSWLRERMWGGGFFKLRTYHSLLTEVVFGASILICMLGATIYRVATVLSIF